MNTYYSDECWMIGSAKEALEDGFPPGLFYDLLVFQS